jgi:DNA-binding NarL/FixJ family response regulator
MDATSQPPLSLATSQSSRSGGSVAILADDAGALERIRAALRDQAGVMSLEDLLGTRDGPPQVVILARPLSSRRTIVELQRLSSVLPSSSIVVISALSDRRAMRRALVAGASGFVHLDDIKTALAPAVRSAAAGYVSVPRSHVRSLHRPEFSHRERQVLRLVVFGRTNGEIARHLCLAESTVKTHLSTAFRKLGAHSRSEAATLVLDDSGDLFHLVFGPAELTAVQRARRVRAA